MSRKPTIKISYPEASEKALQLTEAMVKRAPSKRVVETESEDPIFPDSGELFSGFIRCKTQTGVELTLTLNSVSMDYALETLIRPNLTADERKRILGDSASGDDLLPGSAPAEEQTAPDQEKQIDVEKIPDRDLRTILADLVDAAQGYVQGGQDAWEKYIENAIETAINEINHCAGVVEEENPALIQEDTALLDMLSVLICGAMRVNNKRITELKTYASNVAHYLNGGLPDDKNVFVVAARDLADALFSVQHDFTEDANRTLDAETLVRKNKRIDEETEAQQMQAPALKQSAASRADEDKTDDIEPGLLNDIEDDTEGTDNG